MITREQMFPDYHVTDLDLTIAGHRIEKPKHVSTTEWREAWQDYDDGYEDGLSEAEVERKDEVESQRSAAYQQGLQEGLSALREESDVERERNAVARRLPWMVGVFSRSGKGRIGRTLALMALLMFLSSFVHWNGPLWVAAGYAAMMLARPDWFDRL